VEGSILAPGGAVRVRPLDGGGNETQVQSPASGQLVVRGLENGNYEAVDELGNTRVFTVTEGTGQEIVLEEYGDADASADAPLDPLHGTEAPLVGDESHEIQAGTPALVVDGANLVRPELGDVGETAPPTVPGPDSPVEGGVAPGAVVTDETVGNSSDASEETPQDAVAPGPVAQEPASVAESDPDTGEPTRHDLEPWNLSTAHLAAVLDNDTGEFPQAGQIDAGAAVDELKQRAEAGDAGAQTALEKHELVEQPAVETTPELGEPPSPANPAEVAALEQPGDAELDVPPADDPEHEPVHPDVDPGAQA
jgi:hypothetical protein